MNLEKTIADIRRNPKLKDGDKLIVCVNPACISMLEDAYLLPAAGSLRDAFWTIGEDDGSESAAIRLSEDGDDLVLFHLTRTGLGITVAEADFPCVVFVNTGHEFLTVDGRRVGSGAYHFIQEAALSDPEVQEALGALCRRVSEEIEEARRGAGC